MHIANLKMRICNLKTNICNLKMNFRQDFDKSFRRGKELLAEGKPLVIDFWATWCGPCKMVGPIIEELADEYEGKVLIGKCDIEDNVEVTSDYNINSVPTVLFFKNGEVVDRQVGSAPKSVYVAKIEALLK